VLLPLRLQRPRPNRAAAHSVGPKVLLASARTLLLQEHLGMPSGTPGPHARLASKATSQPPTQQPAGQTAPSSAGRQVPAPRARTRAFPPPAAARCRYYGNKGAVAFNATQKVRLHSSYAIPNPAQKIITEKDVPNIVK
jgi:hypothetical protein